MALNKLRELNVLVVGAGPAGATAALNLAPTRSVALIDVCAEPRQRIGESLPAAVRRLLADMGLWDSFLAEKHSPCYFNRAVWGSDQAYETDLLRDPDGHGWHIDRARFERWLRRVAVERGAELIAPARICAIDRERDRWRILLRTAAEALELTPRFVIDAGGRAAPLSRRVGACRRIDDRLVCGYVYGTDGAPEMGAGFTYVEAVEQGWWYTAPLTSGRRVLAFHTDAGLPPAQFARSPITILELARTAPGLARLLSETRFSSSNDLTRDSTATASASDFSFAAAHSAMLKPTAGPGWCAAGDAAMSFDPLSSQGLLNALFTGLAAADAADRCLRGENEDALAEYRQTLRGIYKAYREHLYYWYGAETRWPDAPFWRRRQLTNAMNYTTVAATAPTGVKLT